MGGNLQRSDKKALAVTLFKRDERASPISVYRPQFVWNQDIPIQVRAMVLAHSTGPGQACKSRTSIYSTGRHA